MARGDGHILIDDAEILFRNFAGKASDMNAEGARNFCVLIDAQLASALQKDDWNVKQLKIREPGDEPQHFLKASLKYRDRRGNKLRPPEIWLVTSKGRTRLDEDTVEVLDFYDIKKVDLILVPYEWAMGGKSGITPYVKSLFFFVAEDALALRYQDIPEIGSDDQPAIESGGNDIVDAESWYEEDQKELER